MNDSVVVINDIIEEKGNTTFDIPIYNTCDAHIKNSVDVSKLISDLDT